MEFSFEQDEGDCLDQFKWNSPRNFHDTTKESGPFHSQAYVSDSDIERSFPTQYAHGKGDEKKIIDDLAHPTPACDHSKFELASPQSQDSFRKANAPIGTSHSHKTRKPPRNRRDELYSKQPTIRRRVKSCPLKAEGTQIFPTATNPLYSPSRSNLVARKSQTSITPEQQSAQTTGDHYQLVLPSSSSGLIEVTELPGVYTGSPKDDTCSPGRLRRTTRRLNSRSNLEGCPSPPPAIRSPSPCSTKRFNKSVARNYSDSYTARPNSRRYLISPPSPAPFETRTPGGRAPSPHQSTASISRKSSSDKSGSNDKCDLYWKRISASPPGILSPSPCLTNRCEKSRARCNSDIITTRPSSRRSLMRLPPPPPPLLEGQTPSPPQATPSKLGKPLALSESCDDALDLCWKRIPTSQSESTLVILLSPSKSDTKHDSTRKRFVRPSQDVPTRSNEWQVPSSKDMLQLKTVNAVQRQVGGEAKAARFNISSNEATERT